MKKRPALITRQLIVLLAAGMLLAGCTGGQKPAAQPSAEKTEADKTAAEASAAEADQIAAEANASETDKAAAEENASAADTAAEEAKVAAPDFTLTDQFGNTHTLSDYRGSVVFLNFWATWCPPCRAEMPDIQKLYDEYRTAGDDSVVILGIAAPGFGDETDREGITAFLEENGYTYPVVMDETGEQFLNYRIFSYPTTFMIDRDGNVYGYVSGALPEETMRDIIRQTVEGARAG